MKPVYTFQASHPCFNIDVIFISSSKCSMYINSSREMSLEIFLLKVSLSQIIL